MPNRRGCARHRLGGAARRWLARVCQVRQAASAASPSLLIATTNAGKFREFCQLLADVPLHLTSLVELGNPPAVSEEGETYAANALHKALVIAGWSGAAVLADDSGLEVDALGGAPGVRSARFAGDQQDSHANLAKLLQLLKDTPPARRTAHFRCVVAVARADGRTLTAEGSCAGIIVEAPRGTEGFGYDPVFFYPPLGLTFAEMPAAQKNQVSHRARACRKLRESLIEFLQS